MDAIKHTMGIPARALILGAAACVLLAFAGRAIANEIDEREMGYLDDALRSFNLTPQELGFDKKWARDDTFRLSLITRLMDNPLEVPEFIAGEGGYCDSIDELSLSRFALHQSRLVDAPVSQKALAAFGEKERSSFHSDALPEEINQAVSIVLAAFGRATPHMKLATEKLTERELELLLVNGPVIWCEDTLEAESLKGILFEEKGLAFDTTELEPDSMLHYITKIDRKELHTAFVIVQQGVEEAFRILEGVPHGDEEGVLFEASLDYGAVVIGGTGTNHYTGDYALIIDLGGDDRYTGRCASGIGVLFQPFSVVIDLAGDDLYASDRVCNLGAGFFGCGVLFDADGNDVYRGNHNALGAGLFGSGILIDRGGRDIYDGGYFTQGAALVGLGTLYDGGGDDCFRSADWTQGFGSVFGYGTLINKGGDDVYSAGGQYTHAPLRPNDYRSFAQGFGMGFRPDAGGGIGFLYDTEGNDFYNAEVYAQATSYWYSIGMLLDRAGNDYYNACQYSQGAGIHLSIGMLMDEGGNDHYFSRFGPSQGEGHDLAIGFLIDKKGNDSYMVSGGQGIGLTNSCGIFIDSEGNDLYASSENLGQGSANMARGFGGFGAFIDIGGRDSYPKSRFGEDETVWSDGAYGIGFDVKSSEAPAEEEFPQRDTLEKDATIERVFEVASLWEVGDNVKRVRHARARFIDMGMDGGIYIIENKMATKDGLELRTMEEVAKAHPDSIEPLLLGLLQDDDRLKRANAVWLLGQISSKKCVAQLIDMLGEQRNHRFRHTIINALGEIKEKEATSPIIPFLEDSTERVRITAASALGKINDLAAIAALLRAFDDRFFTVRIASENSIVAIGDPAVDQLLEKAKARAGTRSLLHCIAALGRIVATQDSVTQRSERLRIKGALIPNLDHKERSIRAQTVRALALFGEDGILAMLQDKKAYETDPFVIGFYRRYAGDR
jgi:hypothetical protein